MNNPIKVKQAILPAQTALFIIILIISSLDMIAQKNTAIIDSAKRSFNQAKFGMFIHWGVYSKLGGVYKGQNYNGAEWIQAKVNMSNSEYEEIAKTFNPTAFDAGKWTRLSKRAGMKYIVFTTKHHDGFCMFKSAYTPYNITDFTPYKRDIVKMIANACEKNGLKLGLYYSIVDWHHPEFPTVYSNNDGFHGNPNPLANMNKYADYEYNQLSELMTNYGQVSFVWFDAGGGFKDADRFGLNKGDSVIKMIRKYQPGCLINSRIGIPADYGTPEQTVPGKIQDQAFEVCMTMNDNWGYAKNDSNWKSSEDLIRKLIEVAHKGGNFLLNVGPDGDGNIPEPCVKRLEDMGNWLQVNGESIYGTRNSLWESPSWGYSTTRFLDNGNTMLYFHIIHWPKDNRLFIPSLKQKTLQAFVLTARGKNNLTVSQQKDGLVINLPSKIPDKVATVIGLEIKGQKFELQ